MHALICAVEFADVVADQEIVGAGVQSNSGMPAPIAEKMRRDGPRSAASRELEDPSGRLAHSLRAGGAARVPENPPRSGCRPPGSTPTASPWRVRFGAPPRDAIPSSRPCRRTALRRVTQSPTPWRASSWSKRFRRSAPSQGHGAMPSSRSDEGPRRRRRRPAWRRQAVEIEAFQPLVGAGTRRIRRPPRCSAAGARLRASSRQSTSTSSA